MTTSSMFIKVYGIPTALALVSSIGLFAALLGDGVWDVLSWLALGTPVAVACWCIVRRRN